MRLLHRQGRGGGRRLKGQTGRPVSRSDAQTRALRARGTFRIFCGTWRWHRGRWQSAPERREDALGSLPAPRTTPSSPGEPSKRKKTGAGRGAYRRCVAAEVSACFAFCRCGDASRSPATSPKFRAVEIGPKASVPGSHLPHTLHACPSLMQDANGAGEPVDRHPKRASLSSSPPPRDTQPQTWWWWGGWTSVVSPRIPQAHGAEIQLLLSSRPVVGGSGCVMESALHSFRYVDPGRYRESPC